MHKLRTIPVSLRMFRQYHHSKTIVDVLVSFYRGETSRINLTELDQRALQEQLSSL